jgi:hypothetical protein
LPLVVVVDPSSLFSLSLPIFIFTMFAPFTLVLFLISLSTFASAFSFTAGAPSECDNLSISWSGLIYYYSAYILQMNTNIHPDIIAGGTGPFQLLIIPVGALTQATQYLPTYDPGFWNTSQYINPCYLVQRRTGILCSSPRVIRQSKIRSHYVRCNRIWSRWNDRCYVCRSVPRRDLQYN